MGRGLNPWLVVASAGTTDTGSVDPIEAISVVTEKNGMWFHLDAAYGGFFLLCEEGRQEMNGVDKADSIVMDPHKGLGLPYGTGAVLIRKGYLLARSNAYYADYMQDAKLPDHTDETGLLSCRLFTGTDAAVQGAENVVSAQIVWPETIPCRAGGENLAGSLFPPGTGQAGRFRDGPVPGSVHCHLSLPASPVATPMHSTGSCFNQYTRMARYLSPRR